jgi:hypothetical protein
MMNAGARRKTVAGGLGALLFAGMMGALPAVYAVDKAGEVVTLTGKAQAATSEGDIRNLQQGHPVNTGDTVVTATNSFMRMKLSDGSFIVLRPSTRFQIEDYKLSDNANESRGFFNLLKGGFRAVTGLIGQRNHSGIRYRTAVATIGIRGTDVEAIDCTDGCPGMGIKPKPGLYFKVHQGSIDVTGLQGGKLGFEQGTGGFVDQRGGPPTNVTLGSGNPVTHDPTPAANPKDCQ